MPPERVCLYCDVPRSSDEHVLSEALGCNEIVAEGVCPDCNARFGHGFEGKFVKGLSLFLNFFKIPNGKGVVPSIKLAGRIGAEEFEFILTGDGRAQIPPRPTQSAGAPGYEKEFRISQKEQEEVIEKNLRRKHADLVWKRRGGVESKQIVAVHRGFDARLLSSSEANRTAAKYALNLLLHQYDYPWVKNHIRDLIAYIKGDASPTRAGILFDKKLLSRFPFEPPKHLFLVICDSRTKTARIVVSLFCLFTYCVVTQEQGISIDSWRCGALDPYKGNFTALFLDGSPAILNQQALAPFPMPEFELGKLVQQSTIGTVDQAMRAAKNAVNFMQAVLSGSPEVPHICYSCQKILRHLTPICEHCGKPPLPEEIPHAAIPA